MAQVDIEANGLNLARKDEIYQPKFDTELSIPWASKPRVLAMVDLYY